MTYLQEEENQQAEGMAVEQENLNSFGDITTSKFSLNKLEQVIEDNKEQLEAALQ